MYYTELLTKDKHQGALIITDTPNEIEDAANEWASDNAISLESLLPASVRDKDTLRELGSIKLNGTRLKYSSLY